MTPKHDSTVAGGMATGDSPCKKVTKSNDSKLIAGSGCVSVASVSSAWLMSSPRYCQFFVGSVSAMKSAKRPLPQPISTTVAGGVCLVAESKYGLSRSQPSQKY